MNIKEKCSEIVVFYLTKSFTEKLETSEFHDGMTLLFSMTLADIFVLV